MIQHSNEERGQPKAWFGLNDSLNVVYEPIIHFYNTKHNVLAWGSQYPKMHHNLAWLATNWCAAYAEK